MSFRPTVRNRGSLGIYARRVVPALALTGLLLIGPAIMALQGGVPSPPPPGHPRGSRLLVAGSAATAFNWNTRIFHLPGFDPLNGYFPSPIYPGTGYQVPTLSAAFDNALGIYYVNNNSEFVELELTNGSVRTLDHVIPLYQLYPSYGTALYGMLDNEFFIDSGYGEAVFFGTTSSSGSTFSIELVNLTTDQFSMMNTTSPVDGTNQQVQYVGNNTVVVMSSNCSIVGYNLASRQSWYAGTMGSSFGYGGTCFESNNIYWIPQKAQFVNVEAHGSSGDHVEQLNATYNSKGEILFTSVATIAVDSGVTFNWVNGIAYNASTDRIAFSAGYWVGSTVYTYDLGYSAGLLTTSGEVRYSVLSAGVNTGKYLDIQRYVYTSSYLVGWGQGTSAATGGTQYMFDPWNGSTILANLTINNGDFGNNAFEGLYPQSPSVLLDINATVNLNTPMYRVVFAYQGTFSPYVGSSVELTPASGPNRTLVHVNGAGYAPGVVYDYCWAPNSSAVGCPSSATFTATSTGGIPANVSITRIGGSAWLAVSEGTLAANFTTSTEFQVTTPKLAADPVEGPNRSLVELEGTGLGPATTYDLCQAVNSSAVGCAATRNFTTNSTGAVPAGSDLTWSGASGWLAVSQGASLANFIASVEFNITTARLGISPSRGPNGTLVELNGSGFGPGVVYDLCWWSQGAAVGCNSSVTFTATKTGTVPSGTELTVASGGGWLAVSQGDSATNFITSEEFNITSPRLAISPNSGPDGTRVYLNGTGLAPSTVYDVCRATSSAAAGCSTGTSFESNATGVIPVGAAFNWSGASGWLAVAEGSSAGNFIGSVEYNTTTATLGFSPSTGPAGTIVTLEGAGYSPRTLYDYCWEASELPVGCPTTQTFTTNATGAIPVGTTVTWSQASDAWLAISEFPDAANFVLAAAFELTSPILTLTPASGPAGTLVNVTGGGLAPSTVYDYCWTSNATAVGCPATLAFRSTASGDVPSGVSTTRDGGSAWLDVSEGTEATNFIASADFTATNAFLTLGPGSGPNRTLVGLSGAGFAPSTAYDACWAATSAPVGCPATLPFTSTAAGAIPSGVASTAPGAGTGWLAISQGEEATNFILAVRFNTTVPIVSLTPGSGPNGTTTGLGGSGLAPSTSYDLCWSATPAAIGCPATTTVTTTPAGTFPSGVIVAPPDGEPWLALSQGSSAENFIAEVEFAVTSPRLAASPASAPVHALVVLSGSGFAPGTSYLACFLAESTSSCPSGAVNFTTDASGMIPSGVSLRAPASANAKIEIVQRGGGPIDSEPFTATVPSVRLGVPGGPSNALTTLVGTGFSASGAIAVTIDGASVGSFTSCPTGNLSGGAVTANATGAFACSFRVIGASAAGPVTISAVDADSGAMRNTSFELTVPSLAVSTVAGAPGSEVYVNGTGFDEGGSVTLTLGHLSLSSIDACSLGQSSDGTITASGAGAFDCLVTVPGGAPAGSDALVATSSGSGANASLSFLVLSPSSPGSSGVPWLLPVLAALGAAVALLAGVMIARRRRPRTEGVPEEGEAVSESEEPPAVPPATDPGDSPVSETPGPDEPPSAAEADPPPLE